MADTPKVCGINAALDEAKAGIDSLKDKLKAGVDSIGDVGALAETIKNKLAEVNVPQVPSINLQQELANLPNLTPDEYAAKVADLKEKFGSAMKAAGQDLDAIINKIPKPAGLASGDAKDPFAGLNALADKIGAKFKEAQEQLSQLNIESVVGDICKDVPNMEVVVVTETRKIVDPQNPQKEKTVEVQVAKPPVVKADPPKTPQKDPVKETPPSTAPAKGFTFEFTQAKLQQACGIYGKAAAKWHSYLAEMLPKYNVTTPERVAAFVANVSVETNWTLFEEDGRYSPDLMYNKLNPTLKTGQRRFPTLEDARALAARGREAIMNYLYANRMLNGPPESGDGFKYRGRGLKQLTGKDNYIRASKAFFNDDRLVQNPDQVVSDKNICVETACWYFKTVNMNPYADKQDWGACAALVNAGNAAADPKKVLGYNDRVELSKKAYAVFKG